MSVTSETITALPTGTWQVDPAHSSIGFQLEYSVGTFRGAVTRFGGNLLVPAEGDPELTGWADVAGIDVRDTRLTEQLMSPEFFDQQRTPKLNFRSSAIELAGGEVVVTGLLTIRGHEREVTLRGSVGEPTADFMGRTMLRLNLRTVIDRTEFGLRWNATMPGGRPALANEVEIEAELYLVRS